MKQGEREAKLILELKGIAFDETHQDNGTEHSLPDLKYLGEDRYLEVTHTWHNNDIAKKPNRFHQKRTDEQLEIQEKAAAALARVRTGEYSDTPEGKKLFHSDLKLVKLHYGYDPTKISFSEQFSEFACDQPIIDCAPENIIREVISKGKTHNSGNTDLFIFVLEDEFEAMMYILRSGRQNGCYSAFFNSILHSPFQVVYVCAWNWEAQKYETENPVLMKFEKTDDGNITFQYPIR